MKVILFWAVTCLCFVWTPPLAAGAPQEPGEVSVLDGSAPPVPPAVIARDADGRTIVRAVRVTTPPVIDGILDDPVYDDVPSFGGFIQQEPFEGEPATEPTDVWLLYDDRHLYVAARAWQAPGVELVANELRRDHPNLRNNDNFGVIFDTFRDRRSGFLFYANPLGGFVDGHITDESQHNRDWNTVWTVRTGRFEGGWTIEMAIPFRSLRYLEGRDQVWGVNFRRTVHAKREVSYLTPIARSFGGQGIMRVSLAATMVGLEAPAATRNIEVKPYAISTMATNRIAEPAFSNRLDGDVGFDVKYGLTGSLTADLTYSTDFAQVEDDEEQVNLTRFSLFFPERREFFLEGQGIFSFGGRSVGGGGGGGGANNTPIMFFSRRIGLQDGQVVPIRAGGRVTGRAGAYSLGLVSIQTGNAPAAGASPTTFSVARIRRDILRRSSLGVIATNRSVSLTGDGSNQVYGADATLSLYQDLEVNAYVARTRTDGLSGDDTSYTASLNYGGDLLGLQGEYLVVGENFNPEVGFTRRRDFVRRFGSVRLSPRPDGIEAIRRFFWNARLEYTTDGRGRLDTRRLRTEFRTEFENNDQWSAEYSRDYELLTEPFAIGAGIVLPPGGYAFEGVSSSYDIDLRRAVSGSVTAGHGSFFSGHRTEVGYRGRIEFGPKLSIEPNLGLNWIDLAEGSFVTRLLSTRANLTLTPRSLIAGLVQYNSSADLFSMNLRFRWEYQPGSDLFVVYSEGRDTFDRPLHDRLQSRSLAIKATRLVRF